MELKVQEEKKRDYAVLVGLRSPVLREDNADEESMAELAALSMAQAYILRRMNIAAVWL